MCDAPPTSREHVPPKCLFPEEKDLPTGVSLRKNLFKVPSCDSHNSQKSHDDEYFLYVLSTSFQINEIGLNHYRTKVRRAAKRNSSILGKIASTAKPVSYIDPKTEKKVASVSHRLDPTVSTQLLIGSLELSISVTIKISGYLTLDIKPNSYSLLKT